MGKAELVSAPVYISASFRSALNISTSLSNSSRSSPKVVALFSKLKSNTSHRASLLESLTGSMNRWLMAWCTLNLFSGSHCNKLAFNKLLPILGSKWIQLAPFRYPVLRTRGKKKFPVVSIDDSWKGCTKYSYYTVDLIHLILSRKEWFSPI